jgi:hypothetical protein
MFWFLIFALGDNLDSATVHQMRERHYPTLQACMKDAPQRASGFKFAKIKGYYFCAQSGNDPKKAKIGRVIRF